MAKQADQSDSSTGAVDRLINREEILQICYWHQGEGLGNIYNARILQPFLNYDTAQIQIILDELLRQGYLEFVSVPARGYRLTDCGKKQGGRLFADSFADFQKGSHGECAAGCCDNGDHSQCGDDCTLH